MNNNTCMICLEDGNNIPSRIFSCSCRFAVHNACLERWNSTHESQCPICRNRSRMLEIRRPPPSNDEGIPNPIQNDGWWKKAKSICIVVGGMILFMTFALLFITL